MNVDIYWKMRVWENLAGIIMSNMQVIKGERELTSREYFTYQEESQQELVTRLITETEQHEKKQKEIAQELSSLGIDVEYIVTNTSSDLKKKGWVYEYIIRQEKIEHGGYVYKIFEYYENPSRGKEAYNTLKEAVTRIVSWYDELESAENVLKRLKPNFE